MATRKQPGIFSTAVFRCSLCGTQGEPGTTPDCGCWVGCPCGWSFEKGEACRNPVHADAKGRR